MAIASSIRFVFGTPPTPAPAGYRFLVFNDDGLLASVDELGVETVYSTGTDFLSGYYTTAEIDTIIDNVNTDTMFLSGMIDTNTGNITSLTSVVGDNTSDIATNTSNIADNTSDIDTNTSDIATNTSNIADINNDTAFLSGAIDTNTSDISTLSDAIDDIELDHGGLTGLSDDDHLQYHNDTRGDLRYDSLGSATSAITAHTTAEDHSLLHDEVHTIVSHDTTATGAELTELTDGSETTLHTHPISGDFTETCQFHCSADSSTITTGAITAPFDSKVNDRTDPTMFSISGGELEVLRDSVVLFSYTISTDITTGNDRSGVSVWMEADPGGTGTWTEISNTRGYTYNRDVNTGKGSFTYSAPFSVSNGDKFRIRTAVYDGTSTIIVRAVGTQGSAIVLQAQGPTGPTGAGSNVIVQDEGSSITGTPHGTINFTGDGVSVSQVSGKATVDIPAPTTTAAPTGDGSAGDTYYNTTNGVTYIWDSTRDKWLTPSKQLLMYATGNGGDNEYMAIQDIQDNNVGYYAFDDLTITGIHCRSVSGDTTVTFTMQDEADSDSTITTWAYTGTTLYLSTSTNVDVDQGAVMKVLMGPTNPDLQDTLLQVSVAQRYTP